ncbi:hypothetical protein [Candidatus Poriferisodalis sp.]|uniref:hypothetical protein n=1 Tax=Candidatus Poriferisodalis sp. TaxID=3101277 RepID=UPI003B02E230
MAETLALAVGVPAVLAAACLASRRSWSPTLGDIRGIALQTVIVIVVMLVIAGGVSTVLLTRGADVTADLQNQNTAAVDSSNCTTFRLNGIAGVALAATAGNLGGCSWTGTTANPVRSNECDLVRSSANGSANSFRYTASGALATAQAASGINVALPTLALASNVGGLCQIAF